MKTSGLFSMNIPGNGQHVKFYSPDTNAEPFPTFDIEINKEDKDGDIDHPEIKKDPRIDKTDGNEASEPNAG